MRIILVLLLLTVLATSVVAQQPVPRPEQIAERAVRDYAIPYFGAFSHVALDHEALISSLCVRPMPGLLEYVRGHYRRLVGAYARISFLRFGPLAVGNRNERLLLWPDPRGIALRQVQAVLADEDEAASDWRSLQQKSVALQGLSALEFVLFGTGSDELATSAPQSFRCRYAHAVAGAIRNVAQEAAAEWRAPGGFASRLTSPSTVDPDYRSTREVLEEFVGALSHGLEAVRDAQLLPFLGKDDEAPRARSAPLWRSNATPVLIADAMVAIATFVDKTGTARVGGEPGAFIDNAVAFEARNVARARAAITDPLEKGLRDPSQLQAYRYLVVLTQSLQDLIGDQLSAVLGLSVGFSSLDGD